MGLSLKDVGKGILKGIDVAGNFHPIVGQVDRAIDSVYKMDAPDEQKREVAIKLNAAQVGIAAAATKVQSTSRKINLAGLVAIVSGIIASYLEVDSALVAQAIHSILELLSQVTW